MTSYVSAFLAVLDTNDRFLRKITIGQSVTEKGFSRTVIVPFSHMFLESTLKKVFLKEVSVTPVISSFTIVLLKRKQEVFSAKQLNLLPVLCLVLLSLPSFPVVS